MVKKWLFTLLLMIWGCISICQAAASGEAILNLLKTPHTTKEQVLTLISSVVNGSDEAQNILKYQVPRVKSIIDSAFPSGYPLLEYVLCKLPEDLGSRRARGEDCLSNNDLLEISQKLWSLDPALASSLKGSPNGSIDNTDLDEAPLIHKIIGKLLSAHAAYSVNAHDKNAAIAEPFHAYGAHSKEEAAFFKAFIDFVIKKYPATLMITNNVGNTCLHYLQSFVGTRRNEVYLAQSLMKNVLNIQNPKDLIDIQNKEGSTALHLAVQANPTYAAILFEKGANPLLRNKQGKNTIDLIIENIEKNNAHSYDNLRLLCTTLESTQYGADTTQYLATVKTKSQRSILHIFAQGRLQEGLMLLKKNGIDLQRPALNQKDVYKKTPFEYMQESPEYFKKLLQEMASRPTGALQGTTSTTLTSSGNEVKNHPKHWIAGLCITLTALGLIAWYVKKNAKEKNTSSQQALLEDILLLENKN